MVYFKLKDKTLVPYTTPLMAKFTVESSHVDGLKTYNLSIASGKHNVWAAKVQKRRDPDVQFILRTMLDNIHEAIEENLNKDVILRPHEWEEGLLK